MTARFRMFAALALLVGLPGAAWAGANELVLTDNAASLVTFPKEFSFPFAGVRYSSMFVLSNGHVTLGANATTATGASITRTNWLNGPSSFGYPQIGTWTDLNPALGGKITAGPSGPNTFTISYKDVPFAGTGGGTFSQDIILNSNGTFQIVYGTVTGLPPTTTTLNIAGFTGGAANAVGTETPVDLSAQTQPIGNGTQTAIFEEFDATTNLFDLASTTLSFSQVLPNSGKIRGIDDQSVGFQIPGGFPLYGNTYYDAWWCSNGFLGFTSPNTDFTPTIAEFLHLDARVAPMWADHNPGAGGVVTVAQASGSTTFSWVNVPAFGSTSTSTFSVTLNSKNATYPGTIDMHFGSVATPTGSNLGITGVTSGYAGTAGTETSSNLSSLTHPYGANEVALFEEWHGPTHGSPNPLDLAGAVFWNAFPGPIPVSVISNSFFQVDLKDSTDAPLNFPFAGARYNSAWINAGANIAFEGGDQTGSLSTTTIPTLFLRSRPRIAPFWRAWTPQPSTTTAIPGNEGSFSMTQGANSQTIAWRAKISSTTNPPVFSEFSVTLNRDGSFSMSYPLVHTTHTTCVTGYAVGGTRPSGAELAVDMSTRTPPATGEGNQTTIWERFASAADLQGLTLTFANGALPIIYMTPPRIGTTFKLAIGDWPASSGTVYIAGISHGPGPTAMPPPDPRSIYLDTTSPLFTWSQTDPGTFPNFLGLMNGFGQSLSPAINIANEPALVGAVLYVTFATAGPCTFGICALPQQAIAFTIQS